MCVFEEKGVRAGERGGGRGGGDPIDYILQVKGQSTVQVITFRIP